MSVLPPGQGNVPFHERSTHNVPTSREEAISHYAQDVLADTVPIVKWIARPLKESRAKKNYCKEICRRTFGENYMQIPESQSLYIMLQARDIDELILIDRFVEAGGAPCFKKAGSISTILRGVCTHPHVIDVVRLLNGRMPPNQVIEYFNAAYEETIPEEFFQFVARAHDIQELNYVPVNTRFQQDEAWDALRDARTEVLMQYPNSAPIVKHMTEAILDTVFFTNSQCLAPAIKMQYADIDDVRGSPVLSARDPDNPLLLQEECVKTEDGSLCLLFTDPTTMETRTLRRQIPNMDKKELAETIEHGRSEDAPEVIQEWEIAAADIKGNWIEGARDVPAIAEALDKLTPAALLEAAATGNIFTHADGTLTLLPPEIDDPKIGQLPDNASSALDTPVKLQFLDATMSCQRETISLRGEENLIKLTTTIDNGTNTISRTTYYPEKTELRGSKILQRDLLLAKAEFLRKTLEPDVSFPLAELIGPRFTDAEKAQFEKAWKGLKYVLSPSEFKELEWKFQAFIDQAKAIQAERPQVYQHSEKPEFLAASYEFTAYPEIYNVANGILNQTVATIQLEDAIKLMLTPGERAPRNLSKLAVGSSLALHREFIVEKELFEDGEERLDAPLYVHMYLTDPTTMESRCLRIEVPNTAGKSVTEARAILKKCQTGLKTGTSNEYADFLRDVEKRYSEMLVSFNTPNPGPEARAVFFNTDGQLCLRPSEEEVITLPGEALAAFDGEEVVTPHGTLSCQRTEVEGYDKWEISVTQGNKTHTHTVYYKQEEEITAAHKERDLLLAIAGFIEEQS